MCLDHIVALWFWIKRLCTNFNLYWFLVVAAASFYLEKSNQSQANVKSFSVWLVRALLSAQFIFGSHYNSQLIIWKMWDEVSFSKFSFYWGRKVFCVPVKLRLWTDPSAGTDVPFISVAVIIEMIRKQIIPHRFKGWYPPVKWRVKSAFNHRICPISSKPFKQGQWCHNQVS